jgi:NUMOD4 motif
MSNIEIWKSINIFQNYKISNLGDVKNSKDELLTLQKNNGYHRISLVAGKKIKRFYIHRLVAEILLKILIKKSFHF